MLAFDHAAGDIIGDGIDDNRHVMQLGEHDAAEAGVLNEAVDALVAAHHDMGDDVDPEPRRFTLADAAIEQIDLLRHLRKQGIERLVQNLQTRYFRIAQFDDDTGAIGGLDPGLAERIAQPRRSHLAHSVTGVLRV